MPAEDARPLPDIFLSYAWKDGPHANRIDGDFRAVGITLLRDVRDVAYRGSIKKFMQRIRTSDFVVMLISDPYLRSENCMYEVTELLSTHELEKRILPVRLPGAHGIFELDGRLIYYKYWGKSCCCDSEA